MTFVVALGGKKGSGKTSLSCYISAVVNDTTFHGSNNILDLYQDEDIPKKVYLNRDGLEKEYNFNESLENNTIKIYSFADSLKQFLLHSFDVEYHQLYGSDDEKNIKTKYRWETLPIFVRWINSQGRSLYKLLRHIRYPYQESDKPSYAGKELVDSILCEDDFYKAISDGWTYGNPREGNMTARELMQIFGTDIGRCMFDNNIWVNATINKIKTDNPQIAIIDDLRFCSEAESVLSNNGIVVILSRNSDSKDIHGSEKDLEKLSISSDNIMYIDNGYDINDKNNKCLSLIGHKLSVHLSAQDDV